MPGLRVGLILLYLDVRPANEVGNPWQRQLPAFLYYVVALNNISDTLYTL